MKYGVSRSTLLITAGVVWLVAGLNILRIGIICWLGDGQYWLFKVCEASLIFLLFFAFIFQKLYNKHTRRISLKKRTEQLSVFLFRHQGMDHHGPDDSDGNHHPRPPFITGKLHCRLLHRIIGCTECNRHPLPPVLVD